MSQHFPKHFRFFTLIFFTSEHYFVLAKRADHNIYVYAYDVR
jgi:hypothetical protein